MSNDNLKRFVQDDGRTMRNLLGIERDPEGFEASLSKLSGARLAQLQLNPDLIERSFDRRHLSAIHHHVTQDIFEWAGKMRDESVTIESDKIGPVKTMAKQGGAQFDDECQLKAGFALLEKMIDVEAARKMNHKDFSVHAAEVFTHINWMHPFREGNGRVQREFIRQYAESSGHELDFRFVTQGRMYEISEQSNRLQSTQTAQLFEEVSDPKAVERMRGPYVAFSKKAGFQQLYFTHAYPGHPVKGNFVGKGPGEFVVQNPKTGNITIAAIEDLPDNIVNNEISFTPKTPLEGPQ